MGGRHLAGTTTGRSLSDSDISTYQRRSGPAGAAPGSDIDSDAHARKDTDSDTAPKARTGTDSDAAPATDRDA